MPGRDTTFKNGYRYGFNGKEADRQPYGVNDEYNYGMRIYDPRVGRFLSIDPITGGYPWYTPYQFAGNNPIWSIDMDGLEEYQFQKNAKAYEISQMFKDNIVKVKSLLTQTTDIKVALQLQQELRYNQSAYAKWIVYLYKHRETEKESAYEILSYGYDKAEPILRITTPSDEVKTIITGKDLDDQPQSRLKAAGIVALYIFTAGESKDLSVLSKGLKYAGQVGKCDAFAGEFLVKFGKALEKSGAIVKKFRIDIGESGLIGTTTQQYASNGFHEFIEVIKDGKSTIFDNINSSGISKEEFIKQLAGKQKGTDKVIEGAELINNYTKEIK